MNPPFPPPPPHDWRDDVTYACLTVIVLGFLVGCWEVGRWVMGAN